MGLLALAGARSVSLPDRCPLWVVEVDAQQGRARVVGSDQIESWIHPSDFKRVGSALGAEMVELRHTTLS